MKTKPKVKLKYAGKLKAVILLLTVVLLCSSGISRGGVSPIDPNFAPIVPPTTPLPGLRQPPTVRSANIIWVSDAYDDNGDGIADDQFWVDLLVLNGHNVDNQNNWRTLDNNKITALNLADLVIVSQSVNSGNYDDGDEPTTWNSIEVPMIIMSPYLARRSRWGWLDSNSIIRVGNDSYPDLIAQDPLHPIFLDMNLDTANMLGIFDWGVSGTVPFISINDVGNGLLLAIPDGDENWTFITEWAAGIEFYPGSGQVPGGKRILFSAGTYERGEFNLNPEGRQLFLNMIDYILGNLDPDLLYKARDPYPADGAEDVNLPLLQWTAGAGAKSHIVYLGRQGEELIQLSPGEGEWLHEFFFIPLDWQLEPGVTYEWRVDEILENGRVVEGIVRTFTTTEADRSTDYPTLVAWWPYDEGIGFSAMDLVGLRKGVVQEAEWVDGRDNLALQFNGVGAHVEAPFVRSPADGPLSILCWVKGNTPGRVIASQQNGVNWLMTNETSELMTELPGPETAPVSTSFSITNNNEWHHVGVVWDWDEASVKLYVDGDMEGIGYVDSPTTAFTFGNFYVGRGSSGNMGQFWQGLIDDVQVYSEALTDEQIRDAVMGDVGDIGLAKESVAKIKADSYQVGPAIGESRTLAIDLNFKGAVGAIAKPGVTRAEVDTSAARLGLEVIEFDERSRIIRLALPYDSNRPDVAIFTGAARQTLDDSNFAEIGLTVTPTGARSPMILTHQFIVQLETGASISDLIGGDPNVKEFVENPYRNYQYLIELEPDAGIDALQAIDSYVNNPDVVYIVANFATVPEFRGDSLPVQWHLNDEPNDADIDDDKAQELMKKITSADVTIAIIDTPVDHLHADLKDNLWNGQGTQNFGYDDNMSFWHGTAVAGCVGANGEVKGSCPKCKLMLLQCNITTFDQHLAFDYARENGADVICCSWGYAPGITPPVDVNMAIQEAAQEGRQTGSEDPNRGCVIVFAMTNGKWDNGDEEKPDISSLGYVIAVSGSTDKDQCGGAGFGDCMEVLAPTSVDGTRGIVTTCTQDGNTGNPNSLTEINGHYYTSCFSGTSAACATTAGVAGLILSVNPDLTSEQVRYLLQNTADKIEHSKANYDSVSGFSQVYIDNELNSTHGYGRINAYEAVRVANQGVDVFLRDNKLDWGNTEQPSSTLFEYPRGFIPYWESPDIVVGDNGVDVLVRNRGVSPAESVKVDLYCCIAGTALPQFSSNNSNQWTHLGNTQTVSIPCPSTEAPKIEDAIAVASFPPLPDELNHYCLLATVQCDEIDPRSSDAEMSSRVDANIPNDNNISLYNVIMLDPSMSSQSVQFYVGNPYPHDIQYKLEWDEIDGAFVLLNEHFSGDIHDLEANKEESEILTVWGNSSEDLRIRQIRVIDGKDAGVMGGITFRFEE